MFIPTNYNVTILFTDREKKGWKTITITVQKKTYV